MAVVIIRDPISGRSFAGVDGHRMYLYNESSSVTFTVPFAPAAIDYGGIAPEWVTVERPGGTPLLLRKSQPLDTLKFSFVIADKVDMLWPQTGEFHALQSLARQNERVLVNYGPNEGGLWRITDVTVSSEQRNPDTNEITRAVCSITLTRASDPAPAVGPITYPPPPPAPPPAPARNYIVVRGDCLWNIAIKYYGNGALWPRIFDANRDKIKDPHWIYPGQVFTIP
jgi:LysM repeat protein